MKQCGYSPEYLEIGEKTRRDTRVWSEIGLKIGFSKEKAKTREAKTEDLSASWQINIKEKKTYQIRKRHKQEKKREEQTTQKRVK